MTSLYTRDLLALASDIPCLDRLPDPDITVVRTSRICGSRLTVDFSFEQGRLVALGQEIKACAIGQASCSWFARHSIGCTAQDLLAMADAMEGVLAGKPPPDEWPDLAVFEPVSEHRARHGAALLPFLAVREALDRLALKTG